MNNKEKARHLAIQSTKDVDDNGNEVYNAFVEATLLEMAQWKDEQFSKFLLWLDDNYDIRRFTDGKPMTYAELIDNFKSMEQ